MQNVDQILCLFEADPEGPWGGGERDKFIDNQKEKVLARLLHTH